MPSFYKSRSFEPVCWSGAASCGKQIRAKVVINQNSETVLLFYLPKIVVTVNELISTSTTVLLFSKFLISHLTQEHH